MVRVFINSFTLIQNHWKLILNHHKIRINFKRIWEGEGLDSYHWNDLRIRPFPNVQRDWKSITGLIFHIRGGGEAFLYWRGHAPKLKLSLVSPEGPPWLGLRGRKFWKLTTLEPRKTYPLNIKYVKLISSAYYNLVIQ